MTWRCLCAVVAFLTAFVGGCGKKTNMAPVRGTVTYLNKPLDNALVVFLPTTPDALPATGLTDSNGRYELMTLVRGDGAQVGKHRVTVLARGKDKAIAGGEGITAGNLLPGDLRIPKKYTMADTSGLEADVPPGGLTADFALTGP